MDRWTGNAITQEFGSTALSDRPEKTDSPALLVSDVPNPVPGISSLRTFSDKPSRETVQRPSDPSDIEVHSLLSNREPLESFLYENPTGYRPPKGWPAGSEESRTHEVRLPPRPLLQIEFGGWRLPVVLREAAVSR